MSRLTFNCGFKNEANPPQRDTNPIVSSLEPHTYSDQLPKCTTTQRHTKSNTNGPESVREKESQTEKGEREGRARRPLRSPSSHGASATLRDEAISLMEASEGLTSCSNSPVPVRHTITVGPAELKSNHSSG